MSETGTSPEIEPAGTEEIAPTRARGGITLRIAMLALLTTALSTGTVAWLGYRAETAAAIRGVESRLRAMAAAMPEVIAEGYHRRARGGGVDDAEYAALLSRLTRLAHEAGVVYVYTCVADGDAILFGSTSATEEELLDGSWSKLLQPYEEPPPELRDVFRDGQTRMASYTDEYGSFRSIFVARGQGADRHVIGVDVGLDELGAIARANLRWYLGVGVAVGAAVSLLGVWVGRRIAAPIVRLAGDIGAFGDEGFSEDDGRLRSLRGLVAKDRTETGELARSFLEMRRRLATYLRNLTRVTAEKERITSQLEIARKIQRGLLPTRPPAVVGFAIAGWSEAADQTGGDFYDWSVTPHGHVIVTIADVTGHGIGPAIMASVCRAYARATLRDGEPLAPLIEQLNRLVHSDTRGGQFVTFFAGVLDPVNRTMIVISAGHGPVLFYCAATGRVESLETHGLPLGITDEMDVHPGSEIRFASGDILFLVSDGFFEWMNASHEQFGTKRLASSLLAATALPPAEIIDSVRREVTAFTAGTAQPDDMTAVVIKCVGPRAGAT